MAGTSLTVPERQYVWGIRYIDDLVLRDRGLTATLERFYALQDANWNVVAICDPTGAVQERYAYTPYGVCQFLSSLFVVQPDGSAFDWNVLYTGRTLDLTGLYYYRERYYHPLLGVFVSRDPIGQRGGINPYQYVGDRPAGRSDPTGLSWWDELLNNAAANTHTAAGCGCVCGTDVVNLSSYTQLMADATRTILKMTFTDANMSKLPPPPNGQGNYLVDNVPRPAHLDNSSAAILVQTALQHCIGGGIVAIQTSCECSYCLSTVRARGMFLTMILTLA